MPAALTLYQVQAKRRIKKALKLRARADFKARALSVRLAAVLADTAAAAANVATLNTLYGTAYVGSTVFVQGLATAGVSNTLATVAAASIAGSLEQLYATVPNVGLGMELPADAMLD